MTVLLVGASACALAALLIAEHREVKWGRFAKMLASTGFIAVALASGAIDSAYGRFVLIALGLSWLGDLLLTYPAPTAFLGGLFSFLLAHLGYMAAFVVRGVTLNAATVGAATTVAGLMVWRWLRPHLDDGMRGPVAGYIVVISAMVAAAIGTIAQEADARIVVGAIAFYLSDLAVARDRFVSRGFVNRAWGLPLYYLAQVLLAGSTASV